MEKKTSIAGQTTAADHKTGKEVIQLLKNFLISSCLYEIEVKELVNTCKALLSWPNEGYLMIIKFTRSDMRETGGQSETGEKFTLLLSTITSTYDCAIIRKSNGQFAAYLPCGETSEFTVYEAATAILSRAQELGFRLMIGISNRCTLQEDMSTDFENANQALSETDGSTPIVQYHNGKISVPCAEDYPLSQEKQLYQSFIKANEDRCLQAFDVVFDWYRRHYRPDLARLQSAMIELLTICRVLKHQITSPEHTFSAHISGGRYPLLAIRDPEKMRQLCKKWLSNDIAVLKQQAATSQNSILFAKDYILTHYSDPLTLENVAQTAHISPYYFSKLFKQNTGSNFVEYLTGIRIEKAKELLTSQELSIKDICFAVGYKDPGYFCRIFKKITGRTPKEYRLLFAGPTTLRGDPNGT